MTNASVHGHPVLETITDPNTPTITLEMARLAFGLIDRKTLYGYEIEDYDRVKLGLEQATPDQAQRAWDAAVRLLDYMPLHDLGAALERLPELDDQLHRDTDYLLTWGLWHNRAEFGYREGVDYVPGEVEEEWTPAIDGPDELDAFNAMAAALDLEPSPMENPDNWRRHTLHGRVWGRVFSMGPEDREQLKAALAESGAKPAAKEGARNWINGLPLASRFR